MRWIGIAVAALGLLLAVFGGRRWNADAPDSRKPVLIEGLRVGQQGVMEVAGSARRPHSLALSVDVRAAAFRFPLHYRVLDGTQELVAGEDALAPGNGTRLVPGPPLTATRELAPFKAPPSGRFKIELRVDADPAGGADPASDVRIAVYDEPWGAGSNGLTAAGGGAAFVGAVLASVGFARRRKQA